MSVKLKYGVGPDGRLHHIKDVTRGAACNCVCPECKVALIANKGDIRQHHFSHIAGKSDCPAAMESALHMAAKRVLVEHKQIRLPRFNFERAAYDLNGVRHRVHALKGVEPQVIKFDEVTEEVPFGSGKGSLRADIVGRYGDEELVIEIAVTNPVSDEKKAQLRAMKLNVVEISLKHLIDREWTISDVENAVLQNLATKKWLSYKNYDQLDVQANAELYETIRAENSEVDIIQQIEGDGSVNGFSRSYLDYQMRKSRDDKKREEWREYCETKAANELIDARHEIRVHQEAKLRKEAKKKRLASMTRNNPAFSSALAALTAFFSPANFAVETARMNLEGRGHPVWIDASEHLGVSWDRPPSHINIPVQGEMGAMVDRRVWQAHIFAQFVHGKRGAFLGLLVRNLTIKDLGRRGGFEMLYEFGHLLTPQERQRLPLFGRAIRQYLNALVERGYLAELNGYFRILERREAA
jgi:hypothetical protein